MDEMMYDVYELLLTALIVIFILFIFVAMYMFYVQDIRLQRTQHDVTYQAANESREIGKTGNDGELRYGEPYAVEVKKSTRFIKSNINLREVRTGVNRGQFTEDGYVYR